MKVLDYDGTDHLIDKIYDAINSGGSADYIVEEGTHGSWYYRKWASGVAECWCRVTMTATSWQAWGNVWEGKPYPAFTFPSGLFTAIPSVTANVSQDSSGGVMYEMGQITQSGIAYIVPIRPISTSASSPYQYFVHARGLWKEFTPSVSSFDASTKTYTPTLASGIAVRSWGKCFVAKIGKIHILSFWGLYSSSAITSDTLILTLESGKKFAGTAGSFSSGSDGAYLRMEANSNTIVASDILANTSYFGQAVFVEL